jgi:hypothetical protein
VVKTLEALSFGMRNPLPNTVAHDVVEYPDKVTFRTGDFEVLRDKTFRGCRASA